MKVELYRRELIGKLCRPCTEEDNLPELIEALALECKARHAVGLAAPQVGLFLQLAVMSVKHDTVDVLINPRILTFGGRDLLETEACLSIPGAGANARMWRSETVQIETGTPDAPDARKTITYKGFPARVAQHEIDHLEGRFYIDRCGPVGRSIVLRKYAKFLKEFDGGRIPTSY